MKIRYYGHVGQATGYGRAAEGMCMSLLAAGAELEIRTLAPFDSIDRTAIPLPLASRMKRDSELDPEVEVAIVHTLPGDCPKVIDLVKWPAYWIAYTTWECLNAPREIVEPYAMFDQVWQPSIRGINAFSATGALSGWATEPTTLVQMPHAFDEESRSRRRRRERFDGGTYRFYTLGAFTQRKNPAGVIRAFVMAFDKGDDVELLIHSSGTSQTQIKVTLASTGFMPGDLPRIRFGTALASNEQIEDIHRSADCFVSAARGEAWNLPCFDAMLAGRHIIAPGDDGPFEYLNGTSAKQYKSVVTPAMLDVRTDTASDGRLTIQGGQGVNGKMWWTDPDLQDLSYAMRDAFESRICDLAVNYDPCERYGYKAVGNLAMHHLAELSKET